MKRILYLDKDFMDSYIAQTGLGIPGQHVLTNANGLVDVQSAVHPSASYKVGGEVKASAFFASGGGSYERTATTETQQDVSVNMDGTTEAVTYIPHDNVLGLVMDHYAKQKDKPTGVGSFLVVENLHPVIYDMSELTSRMSDKAIEFIANKAAEERIKALPNPFAPQVVQERKRIVQEQIKNLKESRSNLETTCAFAQFDVCIAMGDVLAPLKREWMRTSSRDMIFKYDSRLSIFGQITRIHHETEKADNLNPVDQLNAIFNGMWPSALQRMSILPVGDYKIVDPMAVYFE